MQPGLPHAHVRLLFRNQQSAGNVLERGPAGTQWEAWRRMPRW